MPFELDTSAWSGEGTFTQLLIDRLRGIVGVRLVRSAYLAYLTVVGAALGWMLHRDPDTYRYIPASIRQYPGADAVARLFESRGFIGVRCYPVLGGLMTIHRATRA